jgi:hypothetical protein
LVSVVAKGLTERGMNEVGRGVRLRRAATIHNVNDCGDDVTYRYRTLGDTNRVCRQAFDRTLNIDDLGREICPDDNAIVGVLTAALCVKTGFAKDQFDGLPCRCRIDSGTIADDADNARFRR